MAVFSCSQPFWQSCDRPCRRFAHGRAAAEATVQWPYPQISRRGQCRHGARRDKFGGGTQAAQQTAVKGAMPPIDRASVATFTQGATTGRAGAIQTESEVIPCVGGCNRLDLQDARVARRRSAAAGSLELRACECRLSRLVQDHPHSTVPRLLYLHQLGGAARRRGGERACGRPELIFNETDIEAFLAISTYFVRIEATCGGIIVDRV